MAISKKLEIIYHNGKPDGIRSIRRHLSTLTTYIIPRPLLFEAKKITVAFGAFSDKPAMSYNGLFWLKFVKDNCDTYIDIPNKFSTNDVLIADCKNGEIYLNNIAAPELGALGNDWEKFALTPGANHIGVAYSDWVASTYAPTFKIQYREAFL